MDREGLAGRISSTAQQRLWLLHQIDPDLPVYNMPKVWSVGGALDLKALEAAIEGLIARHHPLRTNFVLQDGTLVQKVAPVPSRGLRVVDLTGHADAEAELNGIVEREFARPFDLERDIMLRSTLVRLKADQHVLILVTHHIASDWWGSLIFDRELGTLYQAALRGESFALGELPIEYSDYAKWEREYLESDAARNSRDYWATYLTGAPLLLDLPHDRPRPAVQRHAGAQHSFVIPEALVNRLRQFGRRERATLSACLFAAFQVLLFRTSSQRSFVIGVPVANRPRPEFEQLVGMFMNTLPVRADLAGGLSFSALLKRVGRTMADALDHQQTPFQEVIDAVRPERNLSHAPVFQVMFNFMNAGEEQFRVKDLAIERLDVHNRTSLQDLTLYVNADGARLRCIFEYDIELFDAATMARWAERFLTLLDAAISHPELPLSKIPWIPEREKAAMVPWNATAATYPENRGIHECIAEVAAQTPDAIAVSCNRRVLRYRELEELANRTANHLLSLGAGPDSNIAIGIERSIEMVVGLLGILKAGAAYVPLDPNLPLSRRQTIVDDSGARLLLTYGSPDAGGGIAGPRQVSLEDAFREGGSAAAPALRTSARPAYLIYTSGTTGKPKGVLVSHRSVVNVIESMRLRPGFMQTDTLLAVTPLSFDIAALEIFLPLYTGARVEIATREAALDPIALAAKLAASGATVLQATPATWRMLIDSNWEGDSRLRAWCGGEMLPRDLADRILKRAGSLWNLYGPTETTIWSAVSRVGPAEGPPPVGGPVANTTLHVLDESLQPVPIGVPGELFIGGVGLAEGYWKDPGLTADRFRPDLVEPGARMYKTGDSVRWLSSGELQWLRRTDTQVKLRGHRIELGEIESCLREHPSVAAAAAVIREAASGGAGLVAYVVPDKDPNVNVKLLRQWVRDRLPDYMTPSVLVTLDELPLTPNGKVDRAALPPVLMEVPPAEEPKISRHALEDRLTRIWENVLGIHGVGLRDDFFALGGHSMLAANLFLRIEQEFGQKLPLSTLFRCSTVESLAGLLGNLLPETWRAVVPIQPLGSRPPLFLVSRLHPFCFRTLSEQLGLDQPLYGLQPPGLSGEGKVLPRMEELAAFHIEGLRLIQPEGPYYIGGYSFGAYVAYEMARQLEERREQVALLVVIDADVHELPKYKAHLPKATAAFHSMVRSTSSAKYHWNVIRSMQTSKAPQYVAGIFHRRKELRKRALPEGIWNRALPPEIQSVEAANRLAFRNYLPRPYGGKMILFRPTAEGRLSPQHDGWGRLARGGVERHDVTGSGHLDILEHPYAEFVAGILRSAINFPS